MRKHCQEIYYTCRNRGITKDPLCDIQAFCSDECRSIYHKVLWCNNDTSYSLHLQDLNFLCATSSDPRHQNSTCLSRIIDSAKNGTAYNYASSCLLSILTELSTNCSDVCRSILMDYQNDCCIINAALMGETAAKRKDGDVASMHNNRLWEHCRVESPQMCPAPSCPTSPPSTINPSTPEIAGRASSHHVNWFILLSGILFLSLVNLYS